MKASCGIPGASEWSCPWCVGAAPDEEALLKSLRQQASGESFNCLVIVFTRSTVDRSRSRPRPREALCESCSSCSDESRHGRQHLRPPRETGRVSSFDFRFSNFDFRTQFASNSNLQRGRVMKLQSMMLRNSLLLLTSLLALPAFRAAAQSKPDSAPAAQAKPDAAQSQQKQSKPQSGLKPVPRGEDGQELVEEGPDFLRLRQDWFFKPRAFPIGFIPQGARERALEQKKQMYLREGRFNLTAAPSGVGFLPPPAGPSSSWFSIAPQATSTPFFAPFTSGRVTALAVNPDNPSNVYLGGADRGLLVPTDGGATWFALAQTENPPNSAIPTIAVASLAVDPTS